ARGAAAGARAARRAPPPGTGGPAVSASAATAVMPIFSCDHASDFVRGICSNLPSGQKRLDVRIARRGGADLGGVAFERNASVLQHDELRLVRLLAIGLLEDHFLAISRCGVFGDEERVAELMRDEHRADSLEIPQPDDR